MSDNISRFNEIVKILKDSKLIEGVTPDKVYDTIVKLGPSFIKIGQIMSMRVDLIPLEYCQKLASLRSNVPSIDYEVILGILNSSYDNVSEMFKEIDEVPIGSASMAQVHKARLLNGKEVVIKIKRPGIDEVIKTDIALLIKASKLLQLDKIIKVVDLNLMLDEIYDNMLLELDFGKEKDNLIEFRKTNRDREGVSCPKVYKELCTDNTIVMDYIPGIVINDIDKLKKEGYDVKKIALELSNNYIEQALVDGFFQADPHADNIFMFNDKIMFLDLGMMGRLSSRNRNLLKRCIGYINDSNYGEVSRILLEMSTYTDVDKIRLKEDLRDILGEFGECSLQDVDVKKFMIKMFKMLKDNGLTLDKDITMLVRGICVIEPVLRDLDPETSLSVVLANRLAYDKIDDIMSGEVGKRIVKQLVRNTNNLMNIPSDLANLIKDINNGEVKFKMEFSDSSRQIDKIEKLLHELILGFVDGALIMGIGFCNDMMLKSVFIFFGIVISILLIIMMIRDYVHKGY